MKNAATNRLANHGRQESTGGNRRLAQWRVKWLIEHSTSHQLLWYIDSFVLRNPPLRQAPKRWQQYEIKMKQLIIILTLFSFNALGQKTFTGTYFTTKRDIGFESDIFQFREDGTFSYIFFTCTGRGFGSGNYEVTKNNFLKLEFVNCEECYQTIEIKTEMDSSEFVEIELKIKSMEDDSELPDVHVYFESLKVGVSSDINGDAKLKFPKFDENRTLTISSIGFDPVNIEVPKLCTKISGIVRLGFYWIYNDEDYKTFKIVNWKDSKLKIKRYPDRTVTYDKVDESKVDSLIKDRIGELDYKLFMEKISK